MDSLAQNVRIAVRRLARSPGFTLVAALTLALGIGANTAIFSVVDAALLRALPYPRAGEIARVYAPAHGGRGTVSAPDFVDYRHDSRAFSSLAAIAQSTFALSGGGTAAEQRDGAAVTEDFFRVLAVGPALGRVIGPDDARVGAPPVVVLSDGIWRRRYGGDPAVLGRQIMVDGVSTTVIGVMPPRFDYPDGAGLWTPLAFTPNQLATQRGAHYLDVVGRLRPGVTLDAARADVGAIQNRLAALYPTTDLPGPSKIVTLRESLTGDTRPALLVLLGAVGLLLLVSCANVANLLLARAIGRQREIAVRTALGASRGRIAGELLAEAVTLALIGGAIGLLLAVWGTQGVSSLLPNDQLLASAAIDGRMLAATLVLSVATGLVFGLFPALQLAPGSDDLGPALAGGGRGGSASASAQRAKRALAIAEVALSVVLLTGAGLLLKSFVALRAVDPGFATAQRMTFGVSLPEARYDKPEKSAAFVADLESRLRATPGVRNVGLVSGLPLTGYSFSITAHTIDGRELPDAEQDRLVTQIRVVTPDWFRTMGIPLVRGRGITTADRAGAPNVVVMNASAAKLVFGGGDPIGHTFVIGTTFGLGRGRAGGSVVGVVGDVRDAGLAQPASPTIYLAYDQYPVGGGSFVVQTSGAPTAITPIARDALAAIDPDVPLFEARTMDDVATASIARPRFLTTLLGIFAAVAAALAAIGLYGVIAYAVGERTREIGIRVALGAARGDVLRLVLRGGLALAAAGIAIGLAGSVATSRLLRGLLYGVGPLDAATFVLTAALVLGVATLATWLPARRAARLDPVEALRVE
ncbi:MAG TPA: ABC transporter permease [Gemmatimonadaceae bacterium]|nr:ABC transporter permease [Gemmatimonadaceae bacterium]